MDGAPCAIAVPEFFEGDGFLPVCVGCVVGTEHAVNCVEEGACGAPAGELISLRKRHEIIHVHVNVLEKACAMRWGEGLVQLRERLVGCEPGVAGGSVGGRSKWGPAQVFQWVWCVCCRGVPRNICDIGDGLGGAAEEGS
eukprot:816034-Ditylum_brightwellii.AAC.1